MLTRGMLIVGALVFLAAEAQGATTLTTPFVLANVGQRAACIVTNIDSGKPITVTLELVDVQGVTVPPEFNTCPVPPATLAPRVTCAGGPPVNTAVYCQVVSSSKKVRVAVSVVAADSAHVLEVVGTK
jgi:hypothetical protein